MKSHIIFAAAITLAVFASVTLPAQDLDPSSNSENIRFQWGVQIPMRDGVHLNATVYLPKNQKAPAPCVFTLTPYTSDTYHERGAYFAAHGLPYLTVDVRGRGNSEGTFRPNIQEAKDGHDVVEWLARQPYCNGKVSMWGGSYAGYDQWATAKEFPPHLATIVPAAAPYMGIDFPMVGNIFSIDDIHWLTIVSGHTAQWNIYHDKPFWTGLFREWYPSGRPFADLDSILGNPSATFHEWLSHPHPDTYWDAFNPTSEQYSKLNIPVLTITAAYDGDQLGALTHYRNHMQLGTPEARAKHYLIIGPWDHAGTRTPTSEFGGVQFGPAALLDLPKIHLQWYSWTMGNGPRPDFLKNRVAYYVIGAQEWRYADSLESLTAKTEPFFLSSAANPTDLFRSGAMLPGKNLSGGPDQYVYDPRDSSDVDLQSVIDPDSVVDQRMITANSGKELVYHSAPFAHDTDISGFFKLSAWIAIDQPDTDLSAAVYAIGANGESMLLSSSIIRARYRESLREPKLIRTQEPLLYNFDNFTFISARIKKGGRLRLVVGPVYTLCCDLVYPEKNYNGGGVVAEESIKDARPVKVTLYHDAAHPSALNVPFGQTQSVEK